MNTTRSEKTRKLTMLAMLCALAYVVMIVGRIPLISVPGLVLKYDPKDVIIAVGGFIFGPLATIFISVIVSFVEMITVSDNGIIGFVMNVVATMGFATVAALVYKKKHTLSGAVVGLALGIVCMTVLMLLWNYFLTPLYLGMPREAIAPMLLPLFLPFNLIKAGLNMAITLLIYKPVVKGLRSAKLLPADEEETAPKKSNKIGLILGALALLLLCILAALYLNGIITF